MLIAKMKKLQVSFMVVGFYFGQVMTVTDNSGNTHAHIHQLALIALILV